MKVILVNGSPRQEGCTYTALCEVEKQLNKNGIETEIFQIGKNEVSGFVGGDYVNKAGTDIINQFWEIAEKADGFVFGSPVYFASPNGNLISFMDRVFSGHTHLFRGKPAAGVVSARRAGTTASLDVLNKYFLLAEMPVVSSQYWNMVHGSRGETDVKQDLEGMQIMRTLGNNMSWLLKCIELGKQNNITFPEKEEALKTNFIR